MDRSTILTRGSKLNDRNVLIRIYRDDGEDGNENITIAAFNPSEQTTLEYEIGGTEFRKLFGTNEAAQESSEGRGRISDDVILMEAEHLIPHLRIVGGKDGDSSKALELDLDKASARPSSLFSSQR